MVIGKPFYLGRYEVTQEQWQAVMGTNPSGFKGNRRPVERVSWEDAMAFCRKASGLTGEKLRLPTEAEWEYACRAGTTTAFNTGMDLAANQAKFGGGETIDVGTFRPNAWGLYDMHGNVWEWCSDWYGAYDPSVKKRPTWIGKWYPPCPARRGLGRSRKALPLRQPQQGRARPPERQLRLSGGPGLIIVSEKVPSTCKIIGKLGKNRPNFGKNECNILQGFDPST